MYRINPLAAGMTECERGRCRTKSRLAGWTDVLGTDAQNMSQQTDIREELLVKWAVTLF